MIRRRYEPVTRLADRPTADDALEFQRLVDLLAEELSEPSAAGALTVGVYGEWGAGKTSFLQMLEQSLENRGVHPVWFHAWRYSNEENIWAALLQTVLDTTPISQPWYRRAWLKARLWLDRISWRSGGAELAKPIMFTFRLIAFVTGFLLTGQLLTGAVIVRDLPLVGDFSIPAELAQTIIAAVALVAGSPALVILFGTQLKVDAAAFRHERDFRSRIAFLDKFSSDLRDMLKLVSGGKPLVVFIDDLDRCLPKQTLQVLEAVKVLLDVEGCTFVLAVDRDVVERAVRLQHPEIEGTDALRLAETYLDKIVQIAVALPPIHKDTIESFVGGLTHDADVLSLRSVLAGAPPFNPRLVKRCVSKFMLIRRLNNAGSAGDAHLSPELVARLIVLESTCRGFFREVQRSPEILIEVEAILLDSKEENEQEASSESLRAADFVARYPALSWIFARSGEAPARFSEGLIEPYIYLLRTLAAVGAPLAPPDEAFSSTEAVPETAASA